MTDEELFLETMEDLRSKIATGSDYSLLKGTGLCRQLLLDSSPLAHVVNRSYRLPLRFFFEGINDFFEEMPPEILDSLALITVGDPRMVSPSRRSPHKTLAQFLSLPVAYFKPHKLTVKEIIETCANCFGGVHKEDPESEQRKAMAAFDNAIRIQGMRFSTQAAFYLLTAVIDALSPLEAAVRSKIQSPV